MTAVRPPSRFGGSIRVSAQPGITAPDRPRRRGAHPGRRRRPGGGPVRRGRRRAVLGPGAAELLDEVDLDVFALLEHAKATGKAGELVEHVLLSRAGLSNGSLRSLLFVGVGDGTPVDLRRAGAAVARRAKGRETLATSIPALSDDAGLRAFVEGLVLGSFGFHRRSTGPKETPVARVVLAGLDDIGTRQVALDRALAVAGAGWMSRMMALVPSNEKNPVWMAERAEEIAKSAGLSIEVWDEKRLAAEGSAASSGSARRRRTRRGW